MKLKPLAISFSGGKTSAYMTYRLLQEFKNKRDIVVIFANTGQEQEATLEFIHQCDKQLNFNTIWVEALVYPEQRRGTYFTQVNFNTASRNGEPYVAVIKKYGIPNLAFLHCTRELKQRPITKYIRTFHFDHGKGEVAIGIRADESSRKPNEQTRLMWDTIYPLIDWNIDKQDVNDFWEMQPFNLNLQEHQGNCKWCFKKSFKKHGLLVKESPEIYEFPKRMEIEYGKCGSGAKNGRVFFRGNRNTQQLIDYVKLLDPVNTVVNQDENSGCTESCEPFTEEL